MWTNKNSLVLFLVVIQLSPPVQAEKSARSSKVTFPKQSGPEWDILLFIHSLTQEAFPGVPD